jgi:hypothetical protein
MKEKLLLSKKEFTILESIHKKHKGKLADIYKATLRGEEVICKIIKLERVNNFLIESFLELVCKLRQVKFCNLSYCIV